MALEEKELEIQLKEAGSRILNPPNATEDLLRLLDQLENCLSRVEQSPSESMLNALAPSTRALISKELLRHSDVDVKVVVASCVSEITRITAPEAPYDDELMKEIFQMIVAAFEKLYDMDNPSYLKRVSILETVAKVRSCVVMLDLECDDLILQMFNHFLNAIREIHPDNIFSSMETIMTLVLEESEEISTELLHCLLSCVKKRNQEFSPVARRLGAKVIGNCADKIKPYLVEEVKSSGLVLDDYTEVVASVCQESFTSKEQENLNFAKKMVEESKPSESTVLDSNKLADKMEPELEPPNEADHGMEESSKLLVSNGTVLGDAVDSVDRNSLQINVDSSLKEEMPVVAVDEPEDVSPLKTDLVETKHTEATKKKRVKRGSFTLSTVVSDHSGSELKKSEKPSRKRRRSKEAEGLVSAVSSDKKTTVPDENVKKTEFSSTTGSPNEAIGDVASPDPSHSMQDVNPRKRGRPSRKKEKKTSHPHASPSGNMETLSKDHIADGRQEPKDPEGNDDVNANMQKITKKKVGAASVNVDEVQKLDINSKKESEGMSDSDVKPLRSSSKKERGGNVDDGESSAKVKEQGRRRQRKTHESDEGGRRNINRKEKVSPLKSATKASTKDEIQVDDTPKMESKRKPSSVEKDFGGEIVGRKIKVWWPDDMEFYSGTVASFDPLHKKHNIEYDDGDMEILTLKDEKWEFIDNVDEDKSIELPSPRASEMEQKRVKTTSESSSKRSKIDSSKKGKRGGSAEKSKGDDGASKSTSKSKGEAVKLGKSKDEESHEACGNSGNENSKMIGKANGSGKGRSGKGKSPLSIPQESSVPQENDIIKGGQDLSSQEGLKMVFLERKKRGRRKVSHEGDMTKSGEKSLEKSQTVISSGKKKSEEAIEMPSAGGKKISEVGEMLSAGKKSIEGDARGGKKTSKQGELKTGVKTPREGEIRSLKKESEEREIKSVGKTPQEFKIKSNSKKKLGEGEVRSGGKKITQDTIDDVSKNLEGEIKSDDKVSVDVEMKSVGKKSEVEKRSGGKKISRGGKMSGGKRSSEDNEMESDGKKALQDSEPRSGKKSTEKSEVTSGKKRRRKN